MSKASVFIARIPKWIYITLGIILVLSLTITLLITYRLKPFVANKIKTGVTEATDGLYQIDFTDLDISLVNGSINFDSVSFKPDSAVFEKLRKTNDAPKHLFQVDIDGLAFENINLREVYFDEKLDMNSIVIYKPGITITYNDLKTKEEEDDKRTAYQQISKFLKSIRIDELVLNDADIKYVDKSSATSQTTDIEGLHITVTDFLLDSLSQHDTSRFYYTKNIQLLLKDHKFITDDGLYTISVEDVSSSTAEKELHFSNLVVKPNFPEMEFSRKFKVQHDRYDIKVKEIRVNDIDFRKLNTQRKLDANSLLIDGADVRIFMNRELPPVSFDKGRNYPHMVIRKLKLPTIIDSLQLKNSRISYSEYSPNSQKKGTVTFDRFNALVRNVTNDSTQLSKDHWARASVSTYLMNKGKMNVNLNMNLVAANAAFNFNGVLGQLDMRDLNTLTRNMSLAEIESGKINKAEFNVTGNLRTTSGTLKLYYNDLKVNVLKKDDDSPALEKKGLISALANTLVIKNENPGKDGELRIGQTDAERKNSASFFNLMWNSIFAGLKESVGFTLQSTEKQQVEEPLDKREQRKLEREKRREERKAEMEKKG